MPLRSWSEQIDEWHPPGTPARARFDYMRQRTNRIEGITEWTYRTLVRIPPSYPTLHDEWGAWNWRGLGPVVAQFWSDILNGLLWRFEERRESSRRSVGDVFYTALDGLSWRFFDDEYVPTWREVKRGRGGKSRWVWRMRRRQAIEVAEHRADEYFRESQRGVDA